jgi:hypothetical protein
MLTKFIGKRILLLSNTEIKYSMKMNMNRRHRSSQREGITFRMMATNRNCSRTNQETSNTKNKKNNMTKVRLTRRKRNNKKLKLVKTVAILSS